MAHLDHHNIQQHGFIRKRSCESEIVATLHDFTMTIDLKKNIAIAKFNRKNIAVLVMTIIFTLTAIFMKSIQYSLSIQTSKEKCVVQAHHA